jgi:hypothetical protein
VGALVSFLHSSRVCRPKALFRCAAPEGGTRGRGSGREKQGSAYTLSGFARVTAPAQHRRGLLHAARRSQGKSPVACS